MRRREMDEPKSGSTSTRKGLGIHCKRCFKPGHNSRTCKNEIHPKSKFYKSPIGGDASQGRNSRANTTSGLNLRPNAKNGGEVKDRAAPRVVKQPPSTRVVNGRYVGSGKKKGNKNIEPFQFGSQHVETIQHPTQQSQNDIIPNIDNQGPISQPPPTQKPQNSIIYDVYNQGPVSQSAPNVARAKAHLGGVSVSQSPEPPGTRIISGRLVTTPKRKKIGPGEGPSSLPLTKERKFALTN